MFSKFVGQVLLLPRAYKRLIALVVDVFLIAATVALSFWIRLDEWIRPTGSEWLAYGLSVAIALPLFVKMGLYRAIFRHTGYAMLVTTASACAMYGLIYSTLVTSIGIRGIPRTIGVLQPLLLLLAVIASRVLVRALCDLPQKRKGEDGERKRVLIYGAGAAGRQLASAATASHDIDVVAHVDDDQTLLGGVINGLSVYSPDDLRDIVDSMSVEEIFLAVPSWSRHRRKEVATRILTQVSGKHVAIRTLPSLLDLAHGNVTVSDLREIEIEDLLGRDPVPPNELLLSRNIRDKVAMVTGAGGSIGGELCRQILRQNPARLLLLDFSEHNLYQVERSLRAVATEDQQEAIVPILATVQNAAQVDVIIGAWTPDIIYHAAAYKHVPMVEANVAEGIANNVFGTLNVARAAKAHAVSNFVLISTDKAVRPTNVMGATKRLAEQILQALAAEAGGRTNFSMVRFGNVLGSSGSVVPLFREQIKAGGPITLTHAKVTRYFMTIPEAAQLVIQAGAMARGGDVFVLDMGEPVQIANLARLMIELSGLRVRDAANPAGDIEIVEVGMRPGEKLYEELLIGNDPQETNHKRIMRAREAFLPWSEIGPRLADLGENLREKPVDRLIEQLQALVPEFVSAAATDARTYRGQAS